MIEMNKKYKYRNGKSARVICVDCDNAWPVVSLATNGELFTHKKTGRYTEGKRDDDNEYDLIEVLPYGHRMTNYLINELRNYETTLGASANTSLMCSEAADQIEELETEKEKLSNMLEDVVNELDLSEVAIELHGPRGTPPSELVRLVLAERFKILLEKSE